MNVLTPLAGIFFMVSTLGLLYMTLHLVKRIDALEVDNLANKWIIQRLQKNVIDMGLQLFNVIVSDNNQHPGYVYILKSDSGHYKIGRTIDYENRIKTFNVKLPIEVEFLVLIRTGNMMHLESVLHDQYQHKRVNGEWFSLDRNDLLFVASYPGNLIDSGKVLEPEAA